jgi:hypothetical protein
MDNRTLIIVSLIAIAAITVTAGEKADLSGDWVFSEEKSTLDDMGTQFLPTEMKVTQKDNDLSIQRTYQREYEDDFVLEEALTMDGKECESEFWNSPRITTANWSEKGDVLAIVSNITFERDGQTSELEIKEDWSLQEDGKVLSIKHHSSSDWGERDITMVFVKKETKTEEAK